VAPKLETVPAASLVEDFSVYPRHDVDGAHVADLARAVRAGATLPPVVADRASRRLADGWHRRRATVRVLGAEATIRVEFKDYGSDAELFADAVARNATHGRKLDRQDQVRIAVLGERLGLDAERVAFLLRIEPTRVLELRPRVIFENGDDTPIPAKRVAEPFYGQRLTKEQVQAMRSFSGVRLGQQVSQLQRALAAGLVDLDDAALCARLRQLAGTIREVVPDAEAPAA